MSKFEINEDVLSFLSGNNEEGTEPTVEKTKSPKKAKRKPTNTKSASKKRSCRVNLALTPSLDDKLRARAVKEDISVNQLVNDILTDYFKKH